VEQQIAEPDLFHEDLIEGVERDRRMLRLVSHGRITETGNQHSGDTRHDEATARQ
jgi:hypothetical protein